MGRPAPHCPAVLIVGMLSAWPELFDRAIEAISVRRGRVRHMSPVIDFTFTDYYTAEMGTGLKRKFCAFETLIDPAELAEVKRWTNDLEARFATPDYPVARPINLDPGYISAAKLVLASTKDNAHRLYIGQGIYAEITLTYTRGAFQPMQWTYPDYRSPAYLEFITAVRNDHVARAKGGEA